MSERSGAIRIGLIGAGEHARLAHGAALRHYKAEHPAEVELAAVCDIRPGRATAYAAQFGFARAYDAMDAMLAAEELDALMIVTPLARNAEMAAALLPRRIPLLIEKPPGRTSAEAGQLARLAAQHQAPHMVSFNRRFDPGIMAARGWLAENVRGQGRKIDLVIARMLRIHRREARFVMGTGIHLVDAVMSFMAAPVAAVSRCWQAQEQGPKGPCGDSCAATVTFADGAGALLVMAPDTGGVDETYELIGTEFNIQITASFTRHAIRVFERGKVVLDWEAPAGTPVHVGDGSLAETTVFLAAVRGKGPYWPNLTDALTSMRVAEAISASGSHTL